MQQGSAEWQAARLGIPTASRFDNIITPKKLTPSSQAKGYMCTLLAERYLGYPVEEFTSEWMERGKELEPEAAKAYAFATGRELEQVGFILDDSRRWGCSPDRLVKGGGLLEIKCLSASNHVAALLGHYDNEYMAQRQGQLWVAEEPWVDLFFFNPAFPSHLVRCGRDPQFIDALSRYVPAFCDDLERAWEQLNGGPGGSGAAVLPLNPEPGTDAGAEVSVIRPMTDIERATLRKAVKAAGINPVLLSDEALRATALTLKGKP